MPISMRICVCVCVWLCVHIYLLYMYLCVWQAALNTLRNTLDRSVHWYSLSAPYNVYRRKSSMYCFLVISIHYGNVRFFLDCKIVYLSCSLCWRPPTNYQRTIIIFVFFYDWFSNKINQICIIYLITLM